MNRQIIVISVLACFALIVLVGHSEPSVGEVVTPSNEGPVKIEQPKPQKRRLGDRFWDKLPAHEAKERRHEVQNATEPGYTVHEQAPQQLPAEPVYLKAIAVKLAIAITDDDTAGDIAFKIEQRLGVVTQYRGEVLSDENAKDVEAQILEKTDADIFAAYHAFIQKIAGKKLLILDNEK